MEGCSVTCTCVHVWSVQICFFLCISLCVCVCMYMYVCVCMHMYIYVHMYVYICVSTCMCVLYFCCCYVIPQCSTLCDEVWCVQSWWTLLVLSLAFILVLLPWRCFHGFVATAICFHDVVIMATCTILVCILFGFKVCHLWYWNEGCLILCLNFWETERQTEKWLRGTESERVRGRHTHRGRERQGEKTYCLEAIG